MTTKISQESVMVCVHYGPHGQRLIQRGSQLAQLLDAPFRVLNVDMSDEHEYNSEKEQYIDVWEKLTKQSGGEFLRIKPEGKKTTDVIVDTAREHNVTQIIIGQSGQTFWQEITRGNFVNDLVELLGPIDLHIVSVQRYPDLLEETHEAGVNAYLVNNGDVYELVYELSDDAVESSALPGIFFRELHTDFNNGLFKTVWKGELQYLRIIQSEWRYPVR
ncbi:universal stress protein [Paenibacillus sp. CMAA1364]